MTVSIIVETGSIVANANSYVSVADLQAYALDRGITIAATDPGELLIAATDYLESLEYKGLRVSRDQVLKFPRAGIIYDNYEIPYNTIHQRLKNGQMEAALAIDAGNGPLIDMPRNTVSEKVGELEVHYQPGAASVVINRKILAMLQPFIGGTTGWSFGVAKA